MKIELEEDIFPRSDNDPGLFTLILDDGTKICGLEKNEAEAIMDRMDQVIAKNRRLDRMLILGWVAIVIGVSAISYWLW